MLNIGDHVEYIGFLLDLPGLLTISRIVHDKHLGDVYYVTDVNSQEHGAFIRQMLKKLPKQL